MSKLKRVSGSIKAKKVKAKKEIEAIATGIPLFCDHWDRYGRWCMKRNGHLGQHGYQ